MKRTIIDPTQFELEDKVVAIKRVSKTVKGRTYNEILRISSSW